ncbi:DUF1853 family protein [Aquimarina sp. I32.4]|uniref:DUF1853 family protein n=1 Tax=Aquimarina sp. I32.4 TaxID=2053903 RepID=UPI000CDE937B|nr:DUF1853 family protein [Aquimarina sp. I32.4]
MSIKNEYEGFLTSASLWINETLFDIPIFDIQTISETNISTNYSSINIREDEVLGKRVEHFFEYFITNSNRYTLLAKNIQVFCNKTTIGELDFILKDHLNDHILHVELVYKFYLYNPNITNELERWIGPNCKDTLLQKVHKLKTKQFPLLQKEETKSVLENIQINPDDIQQRVCYLGNLFVPFFMKNKILPKINNKCIIGFWITTKMFTSANYSSYLFYIPKKKDWIIAPKHCTTWFSYDSIIEQVQHSLIQKKSPLLWIKSNGEHYDRCFIVWW